MKTSTTDKKHQKQDQKNEGGILSKELPIDVSNIMPVDTKTKKGKYRLSTNANYF